MYSHMHTLTHILYIHVYTCILPCACSPLHTHVHTMIHALPCVHSQVHTFTHTCTYLHAHSHEGVQLIHTCARNAGMAQLTRVLAHSYICTLTTRHMLSHTPNRLVHVPAYTAAQMHVSPQMCLQLSWCTDRTPHRKGGGPAPDLGPQISAGRGLCGVSKEPKTEPAAPDSAQEPWACLHLFPSRPQRHF